MNLKYTILILLLTTSLSLSLKSTELCNMIQKESKGTHDSNLKCQTKCELIGCHGKYPIQCGQDKCTINQQSCDRYLYFTMSSNSYKYKSDMDKFAFIRFNLKKMHNIERKKLKYFNENIQNCTAIAYQFKPSDVCLIERKIFKSYGSNYKRANFTCSGIQNFHCGQKYCTAHKTACEFVRNKSYKPAAFYIKPCEYKKIIN